jgi:HEAT repeat protein
MARRSAPSGLVVEGRTAAEWTLDLNSPSADKRDESQRIIAHLNTNAIPDLVHLLRTPHPVLAKPVKFIGWRLPARTRNTLFRWIDPDAGRGKRIAAAYALKLMGTSAQPALSSLREALRDEPAVAWHAAQALSNFGQPGVNALARAIFDLEPAQAALACYALGMCHEGASNAIPVLAFALQSGHPMVAEKAAGALGAMRRLGVPPLIESLANRDPDRRAFAAKALGSMGLVAREALGAMTELLKDAHPAVRVAAVDGLIRIGPRSPLTAKGLAGALNDPDRVVRLKVLEALRQSPDLLASVQDSVVKALADESPEVRGRSATLLGHLKNASPDVLGAMKVALEDPNDFVRTKVQEALYLQSIQAGRGGR